eukprot:Rhum_TRINITY_DN25076_c0_g1::Rhum_TRINITY_DN25076_c0_g1_i1::g.181107::m.181107/K20028/ZDHHC2_15_20; palmitoyltransferase ZDHHC2/15/20
MSAEDAERNASLMNSDAGYGYDHSHSDSGRGRGLVPEAANPPHWPLPAAAAANNPPVLAPRVAASPQQQRELQAQLEMWRDSMPHYGCTTHRAVRGCMVVVVSALLLLTYVAYVVTNRNHSAGSIVCIIFFHILFICVSASYFQIVMISPGTVPTFWNDSVAETAPDSHTICRKCNMYKPPRSHYDSATQRLVLNMDHYCPWVANTVGYFNRKFFILFVLYTCISSLYVVITLLTVYHDQVFPFHSISSGSDKTPPPPPNETASPSATPAPGTQSVGSQLLFRVVFIVNAFFAVVLCFFTFFHIRLALSNETTIENEKAAAKYDVGKWDNWQQVFGENPWYWFLPLWGNGPGGNGIDWPLADQSGTEV